MSVAALRARFRRLAQEARQTTTEKLSPANGVVFLLTELNGRAIEAAALQWKAAYYDWPEVMRRYPEPDRIDVAMWVGERLIALGLAVVRGSALSIELVEGDGVAGAPLKGSRAAVLLDAFANYAQLRERSELRLEAKNPKLAAFYETAFGFERVFSKRDTLYWRRRV